MIAPFGFAGRLVAVAHLVDKNAAKQRAQGVPRVEIYHRSDASRGAEARLCPHAICIRGKLRGHVAENVDARVVKQRDACNIGVES